MGPCLYTGLPEEAGEFLWDLESKFYEVERLIDFCGSCVELLVQSNAMAAAAEPIRLSLVAESEREKAILERQRPGNWAHIAARMFVITAWEISHHRDNIVNAINKNSFTSPHVDRDQSKREKAIFRTAVGDYLQTFRYWSAHGSEGFSDKKSTDKIRQPLAEAVRDKYIGAPEGAHVSVVGALFGDRMTMTYKGRVVSIAISWETVDLLRDWIEALKASMCHFIDTRSGSIEP
jgi:hypothetical protein